jgi:exodeoxyribonuclease-3
MKIVTWNVNSIRRRLDGVLSWLERQRPDVVCLQETKCTDDVFPWIGFKSLGYEVSFTGQQSYNGVAIVSRSPQKDRDFYPLGTSSTEKRAIAATIDGVRILNVYVPYGEKVGSAKFSTKLEWLKRLNGVLRKTEERGMVISGDFNVAPDDRDVYDPIVRRDKLICSTPERDHFDAVLEAGFIDAFRHCTDEEGHYTWWSYRPGAVERNRGLRIDHHLVHASLKSRIQSVDIDTAERKNPDASDHTPVTLTLRSGK